MSASYRMSSISLTDNEIAEEARRIRERNARAAAAYPGCYIGITGEATAAWRSLDRAQREALEREFTARILEVRHGIE